MRLALAALAVASGAGLVQVQTLAVPRAAGVAAFGNTVYVRAGVGSLGQLRVFARDARSGKLRQLRCVARNARRCTDGRGLETPSAIAVSPDGRSAYVTAQNGRSLGVYARSADGRLVPRGSVTGLSHPRTVVVSADGRNVYVGGDSLWMYSRAPTGALTLLGSFDTPVSSIAIEPTPTGEVYTVAGGGAHGVVTGWPRDPATGELSDGAELDSPGTAAIQQPAQVVTVRDGFYVAATVSGAVSFFDYDLRNQKIARGLPLAFGLAVTSDRVYVAYRDGVAVLDRDLRRLRTVKLRHATGVAAVGRSVYAVSPDRVTVFARTH